MKNSQQSAKHKMVHGPLSSKILCECLSKASLTMVQSKVRHFFLRWSAVARICDLLWLLLLSSNVPFLPQTYITSFAQRHILVYVSNKAVTKIISSGLRANYKILINSLPRNITKIKPFDPCALCNHICQVPNILFCSRTTLSGNI